MDLGKRGLRVAFRELYFYMDLIDQQVTRTMTRAQWGILGYGPYADLPLERREEVVDRCGGTRRATSLGVSCLLIDWRGN